MKTESPSRLKRVAVAGLAALSALLCLVTVCMWAMSYQYFDMLHTTTPSRIFDVESCRGEAQVVLTFHKGAAFNPGRRIGLWTREPRNGNYISRYIGHYEDAYDFVVGGFGMGWNRVASNAPGQHHYRLLLPYWLLAALWGVLPAIWLRGRLRRAHDSQRQTDSQLMEPLDACPAPHRGRE